MLGLIAQLGKGGVGWLALEAVVIRRAIMTQTEFGRFVRTIPEFCRDCVARLRNVDVDKGGGRKRGESRLSLRDLHKVTLFVWSSYARRMTMEK